jgi:hypothetical protein
LLGLVAIRNSDAVVHGTKVGCSGDKIDVVIRIIVLLEFNRHQAIPRKGGCRRELCDEIREIFLCAG